MRRKSWITVLVFSIIGALAGGYAINDWVDRAQNAEQTAQVVADDGDDLAARVQRACAAGGDAAAALRRQRACAQADKTRETIEDAPVDPQPVAGPVQTRYVPVPGPTGPRGLPGSGDDGQDGADSTVPGPAGADSTVPGPIGPQGPAGKDGESITGPAGRDGRGIANVACTGGLTPITFTFTYDDGTAETVTCGQLDPVAAE